MAPDLAWSAAAGALARPPQPTRRTAPAGRRRWPNTGARSGSRPGPAAPAPARLLRRHRILVPTCGQGRPVRPASSNRQQSGLDRHIIHSHMTLLTWQHKLMFEVSPCGSTRWMSVRGPRSRTSARTGPSSHAKPATGCASCQARTSLTATGCCAGAAAGACAASSPGPDPNTISQGTLDSG